MEASPVGSQPERLTDLSDIYLRPRSLVPSTTVEDLIDKGQALPLAGGPLAFLDVEVIGRRDGGRASQVLSLNALRDWAAGGLWSQRVETLLTQLSGSRQKPRGGSIDRPLIMGIVNVTPDSFSDAGEHLDPQRAVDQARTLAAAGADIIDIGGESTRPRAEAVSAEIERQRIVPVFDRLAAGRPQLGATLLSIDTRRAETMALAVARGAALINDVSALSADPASLKVAAESGAHVALMHMQGEPATMNRAPRYQDVALDVFDWLEARIEAAVAAGIPRERLIVDPGIGFGKKGAHNMSILSQLALFHGLGCPLMLGVSRKGLSGAFERARPPKHRLPGSLAAALHGLGQGVQIVRVHDVAETRQAFQVWREIGAGALAKFR